MTSTHLTVAIGVILAVVAFVMTVPDRFRTESAPPRGVVLPTGPAADVDPSHQDHDSFAKAYAAKLANEDYQALKTATGLPKQFQAFPEEAAIKAVRSRIAESIVVPPGAKPAVIPTRRGPAPAIDGRFAPHEWQDALEVAIGVQGAVTTMLLVADDEHLYLACDAENETTDGGYDQFRFYVHVGITPLLVNERIHVGRRAGPLGGIRQTRIRFQGEVSDPDAERWKTYDISDWQIYQHAQGASMIDGHRRYEAVLQLAEVGLHRGVPFPAWSEVETDPQKKGPGTSGGRQYLGRLGAQTAPVWFVIQ